MDGDIINVRVLLDHCCVWYGNDGAVKMVKLIHFKPFSLGSTVTSTKYRFAPVPKMIENVFIKTNYKLYVAGDNSDEWHASGQQYIFINSSDLVVTIVWSILHYTPRTSDILSNPVKQHELDVPIA